MLIQLSNATLADDLCAHFRRSGFSAESVGGSLVEVSRPDAPDSEQARREVELHLRVWQATHPEASVELEA
jgi:hypothetical protein